MVKEIKSVYDTGNNNVEILKEIKYRSYGYIYRVEKITDIKTGDSTELKVCYDFNGLYLGNNVMTSMLCRKYKLSNFECLDGNIACIGYCEHEEKWYGWSHRAIHGFGIDDEVKPGDCGYVPANKEDMLKQMCAFWDIGLTLECETPDKHCTKTLLSSTFDFEYRDEFVKWRVIDPNAPDGELEVDDEDVEYGPIQLGIQIEIETKFDFDRKDYISTQFELYPSEWKGAWTAETIDDARQMAIDFAKGVG